MVMEATFDIRRPTTMARHSTAGIRRLRERRHSTFNSRRSSVGCRPAVDRRMSNVVCYSFSDATKGTFTAQEVAPKDMTVAPKTNCVAPKVAPKTSEVAPKGDEVAPKNAVKNAVKPSGDAVKNAVKNAVKPSGDAVKNAVKNAVKEFDAGLRETIIEKCAELYCFLRVDPRRTILTAVESLGFSPRSVAQYLNVLKDAHVLEHVGPTNGGTWKFLI